jgi:hypothetical protein
MALALIAVPTARVALAGPPALAGSDAEHPVTARLVTDATTIAAGRPFLAGVELTMHAGWHVYWKNPGDAGLSTEIAFELPPGFTAGPVRYPVPETFEQPGEIRGYGYSEPVVLFAEITPPTTLEAGTIVSIDAKVDWLACERVCIPGGATLAASLPVGTEAIAGPAGDTWREALPIDGAGARPFDGDIGTTPLGEGRVAVELELSWRDEPPGRVEWIPAPPEAVGIENATVHTEGRITRVRFEAFTRGETIPDDEQTMETVIAYHTADGRRQGVVVPVELAALASAGGS